MRRTLIVSCALLGLSLAACGGGSGGSADPSIEPLARAAELEEGDRMDTRRSDHEELVAVTAAQPSTRPMLTLVRIDGGDAEDGSGNIVHVGQRIGVDLDAHAFPPRALDPVLSIGALRFVHYSHPRPGVLRFVLDDASRLALGAELSVQYGEDTTSRRVLLQAISAADIAQVSP